MKSTIVICSYNRPVQAQTQALIDQMTKMGAAYVPQTGSADVTLARNFALTGACAALRKLNEMIAEASAKGRVNRPNYDTFLMVDDDMLFEIDQAQELINYTRKTGMPASALYATMHGSVAAMPIETPIGERQLWLSGLGLLAIPAWRILKLEETSERFTSLHGKQVAFTSSSTRGGKWYSEDFELCSRLGGVHVLPMAVGHLKTIPIYPDEETVRRVRDGEFLPDKLTAEELDELEPHRIARNADGGRG
jgi:hypothetical protein